MSSALTLAALIACIRPGVVDGDGLRCAGQSVRLWGIDAPELRGPSHGATYPSEPPRGAAQAAARRLAALTRGEVACTPQGRSYERVVAVCRPGGQDVGAQLVREGLAVERRKFSRGAYSAEEAAARITGVSVWGAR